MDEVVFFFEETSEICGNCGEPGSHFVMVIPNLERPADSYPEFRCPTKLKEIK